MLGYVVIEEDRYGDEISDYEVHLCASKEKAIEYADQLGELFKYNNDDMEIVEDVCEETSGPVRDIDHIIYEALYTLEEVDDEKLIVVKELEIYGDCPCDQ